MACSVCGEEAVFVAADREAHTRVCANEACLDKFAGDAVVIGNDRRRKRQMMDTDEASKPVFGGKSKAEDENQSGRRKQTRADESTLMDQEGVMSLSNVAKTEYMQRLAQFQHEKFPYHKAGRIFDQFILDDKDCPIWDKYKVLRFLGSGTYGMVFEISNIPVDVTAAELALFTPENTEYYALKCESLTGRGLQGMQEVQAEVAINELLLRLDKWKTINVLHMYDWLRCRAILSTHIPRDTFQQMGLKLKLEMFNALTTETDWQMMLLEDADHTLGEFYLIQRAMGNTEMGKMIQSITVQIFCTLYMLQQKIDFKHGDLSVNNVMVINAKKKIRDQKYLVYHLVDKNLGFVVPLRYTSDMLAVLSDKGFSSARYMAGGIDNVVEIKSNAFSYYPTSEIRFLGNLQQASGGFSDAKTNEIVNDLRSIDFITTDPKYRIDYPSILRKPGFSTFRYDVPTGVDFSDHLKNIISRPFNSETLSDDINAYHVIPIYDEEFLFKTPLIESQRK